MGGNTFTLYGFLAIKWYSWTIADVGINEHGLTREDIDNKRATECKHCCLRWIDVPVILENLKFLLPTVGFMVHSSNDIPTVFMNHSASPEAGDGGGQFYEPKILVIRKFFKKAMLVVSKLTIRSTSFFLKLSI